MTDETTTKNRVDYDFSNNRHSTGDSEAALRFVFPDGLPRSVVDVGCGPGTWLWTLSQAGVTDYIGVDGVDVAPGELLFDPNHFLRRNLATKWDLGRRFEAALCLEVAEHLDACNEKELIDGLVRHADHIVFSAACPGQPGQHHLNCQWPAYWQALFNERGYVCDDAVRWRLWDVEGVDPWYKQNMFIARLDSVEAGHEPRMRAVVHPEMLPYFEVKAISSADAWIVKGGKPTGWYFRMLVGGMSGKVQRRLQGLFGK